MPDATGLLPRRPFELRFAGGPPLALGRQTVVMGVINLTPDSFSDGGAYADPDAALCVAEEMVQAGAGILDLGGESTRPGATEVDEATERERVIPVLLTLRRRLPEARISVDTRRASVARAALDHGADMINDVSGLGDPGMLPLLVRRQVPVVIMHMRGTPESMQADTRYEDLLAVIVAFLSAAAARAVDSGLGGSKILVDPGIGFGKSTEGNLTILKHLSCFAEIDHPLLVGASRKSFIGKMLDLGVDQRLEGSLAVAAWAAAAGAHVVRAHDVRATVRSVRIVDAILAA